MKYLFILGFFCSCSNIYYVVRNAEKSATSVNASDPSLSDIGLQRSKDLNAYFGNKKPDSIFVSKYLRTQQTAAPTAAAAGLTSIIINQTDTNAVNVFIKRILSLRHMKVLIVGHSNTVPLFVKGLSGITINPISENDYDNIYLIKTRKKHRHLSQKTYGITSP